MIKLTISVGIDAFEEGNFVYIWFKSKPRREPFYVGETSKSLADRVGLHIRKSGSQSRSGAVVGNIIHQENWPKQEYTILSFSISDELLLGVAKENGEGQSRAAKNRARKAIEYALHSRLIEMYPDMHRAKRSRWGAKFAREFCDEIIEQCSIHVAQV